MDLIKVYIIQSITAASNNLRLNSQQIEVVGLLRETILNAEDLGESLIKMKKSTLLSKLAIRLSEIYSSLSQGKVDFMKISEQFREHSRYLIRDLNQFLESISPVDFKDALKKINEKDIETIDVVLSERETIGDKLLIRESNALKEEIIMQDENEDNDLFYNFEEHILAPIKSIDDFLKRMPVEKIDNQEFNKYSEMMEKHAIESGSRGFGILSDMHRILSLSFKEISNGNLDVNRSIIESLRACLIVIAAVVKGKELDITDYLNKAELFGRRYFNNKNRILNK